jgi:pilus assembly protein Flp/PilA
MNTHNTCQHREFVRREFKVGIYYSTRILMGGKFMFRMAFNWTAVQLRALKNEEGQGMVEYALIIAFIAIVVIAGLIFLGPIINKMFMDVGGRIQEASPTTVAP